MKTGNNFREIDSTHLKGTEYNEHDRTMDVHFQGGQVYRCYGVPPTEHEALHSAPSSGEYYHQLVKDQYFIERIK